MYGIMYIYSLQFKRRTMTKLSKARLQQIKNARAARARNLSIRQATLATSVNGEDQESANEDYFWHDSSDDGTSSDSDDEEEGTHCESTDEDIPEPKAADELQLKWNNAGESALRAAWGTGSKRTQKRKVREQKELRRAASQSYSIVAMFKRQKQAAASSDQDAADPACLPTITAGPVLESEKNTRTELQATALARLDRLIDLVTEQEAKYGFRLQYKSNFFQRHLMVKQFLSIQARATEKRTRRQLAVVIAEAFGRGQRTARNIVRWERSWVAHEILPGRKTRAAPDQSIQDEDLKIFIREFARRQGDRKY
jgi:hypothetical protein